MSFTVTTSASTAVSTLTSVSDPDTQAESFDSYATEHSLSVASAPDPSDVLMLLGGEATAVGENTLALADIEVTVDGTGPATSAHGSATFVAVAESPGDATAFATADSFGYLSGTDFLFVVTANTQIIHQGPDQSLSIATSETTFFGMDFGSGATGGSGGLALDLPLEGDLPATSDPATGDAATSDPETCAPATDDPATSDLGPFEDAFIDIEGNLAVLDVDAEVLGQDTFLEVEASVLTIEDTLSTITTAIIAAAG